MININDVKEKIENLGYIATEELIYDTYNALCMFSDSKLNSGQDIYAICLEGPPGAGKTEFAKTYTKICNEIFDKNVEMVDYQCDATTGKTELFEDINISAAIRGDADHVNIPGKLVEAIKKVNSGKKVILFIDEYDKAREETDAFLLQFLQSGKINSTQHGDLEVEDKYKSNLQVILCKNDMREELSGPLSRRIRILRLDYMEPSIFYKVANNELVKKREDKVNDGLLNLVTLMYQHAYKDKDVYDRLPSCSEMLIALEDADRLLKRANAPQYIIYNTIIKNMFKSEDDIKTFENSLQNGKLNDLIKSMKNKENKKQEDINILIAAKVFKGVGEELNKKSKEMQKLIDEYVEKFKKMEEDRIKSIEEEKNKILLENGKLVSSNTRPSVIKNFDDEAAEVKRGYDIFESSNGDWTTVASIRMDGLSHNYLIDNLVKMAHRLEVKIYENGVLLKEDNDINLILVNTIENNKSIYKVMCNKKIIPSTYINDIVNFIIFATQVYYKQYRKEKANIGGKFSLSTLVYNDIKIDKNDFDIVLSEGENVYYIEKNREIENINMGDIKNFTKDLSCKDLSNVIKAEEKLIDGKKKVLKNE